MTGRQLITMVVQAADLDAEFPLFILYRDSHGCVEYQDKAKYYQVVNGKICVENDFKRLTN